MLFNLHHRPCAFGMNKTRSSPICCKDSKNKTKKLQQTRKTCMLRLYLFAYARKCFFVLPYNTFCICPISVWFQALEWLFQSLEWWFHDLEWWFHALEWQGLLGNSEMCLGEKKCLSLHDDKSGVGCKDELMPCFTIQSYCFLLRKARKTNIKWMCCNILFQDACCLNHNSMNLSYTW